MKTPKTTKGGPETGAATDEAAIEIRRIPAHVGVIDHREVPEGKPAQAGQPGEVRPIESGLVGTGGELPAAAPRDPAAEGRSEPQAASRSQTAPSQPTPSEPAPANQTRRGGFWPLALGGAVAAGLGAVATIYALPHLPSAWVPDQTSQAPAEETAMDRDEILAAATEAARQAAQETAPDTAALIARIEALEQQPEAEIPQDLSARLDALEQQSDPDALGALRDDVQAQAARIEELAARPAFDPEAAGALQSQIEAAAAEAEERLQAAQAEAQELQDAAAESTRRAQAVAAIASLQTALDQGVTPDQARETLEGAGLDLPEALQQPVPSLTDLQSDFPEAARAALRASFQDTSASGEGNLLTNFLRAQTGARSIAPRDGDDADAVLSRADAAVQAGRIADAVTEVQTLPDSARAAPLMAEWLAGAQAYSQAQAALTDLSSGTN